MEVHHILDQCVHAGSIVVSHVKPESRLTAQLKPGVAFHESLAQELGREHLVDVVILHWPGHRAVTRIEH